MARARKKGGIIKGFIIVIILAALAAIILFKSPTKNVAPVPATPETPTSTVPIIPATIKTTATPQKITEGTKSDAYSIDVTYPKIAGLSETASAKVNADIASAANTLVSDFKDGLAQLPEQDPSTYASDQSVLLVSYKLIAPAHGIVAVELNVSDYTSGAAHPNNYVMPLDYAAASGAKLALKDIFVPGTDYLKIISDPVVKKLQARYGADWFTAGAEPKEENYQNFIMTPTALTIIFNPYEVAAYAAGVITVDIPLSSLDAVIAPEFASS